MPTNVFFLGLKAQFELPAYVRRFDVGLLPFIVSDMTHAVSPLKVFEYLASGVPVAAPPLRALDGLDGVAVNEDLAEAVRLRSRRAQPDAASMIDQHSWSERVARIIELAGVDTAGGEHSGAESFGDRRFTTGRTLASWTCTPSSRRRRD